MNDSPSTGDTLLHSHMQHRLVIGILGMALPFVLFLGNLLIFREGLQGSLSAYYHTGMRGIFVGILWVIGFFLLAYKGYDNDSVWGDLACLFAVVTALFPARQSAPLDCGGSPGVVGWVHNISAGIFLCILAWFALGLFTRTKPGSTPTPGKIRRNRVYRICGCGMVACLVLMAVYMFLGDLLCPVLNVLRPVFWLESLAIVLFGISWFVKGGGLWKDLEEEEDKSTILLKS